MAEHSDLTAWQVLHARAGEFYRAAVAEVTDPEAATPADPWTAGEVMAHVAAVHSSGEAEETGQLGRLPMLTLDLAVHAWDLARSQGSLLRLDDALCLALHEEFAPYTHLMAQEGAFAPPVPVPADAPPLARLVALCGRDPGWAR